MATERLNFRKKIRGMKLKLCINVHDISRYINYFLLSLPMCFHCYGNLSFHILIMGKVEIGIYFYVTSDIDKSFTEMVLE